MIIDVCEDLSCRIAQIILLKGSWRYIYIHIYQKAPKSSPTPAANINRDCRHTTQIFTAAQWDRHNVLFRISQFIPKYEGKRLNALPDHTGLGAQALEMWINCDI